MAEHFYTVVLVLSEHLTGLWMAGQFSSDEE
jgi:hypothetical protein